MKISEQLSCTGTFFFRWRSYLPLLLLPVFLLSFIGYEYPFGSHKLDLLWEIGCFLISMLGLSVRILTGGMVPSGTSGRNTKRQKADVLNTTGVYSIVRHPLYLGNYLIALGISLFPRSWSLPIIVSLAFILYYERIIFAEEAYLESKFGDRYRDWAERVPTIIPRFKSYQSAELSFSWRAALRREFHGAVVIVATFFMLEVIADFIACGEIRFDPFWTPLFVMGLSFFLVMRALKKTPLLKVKRRSPPI